MDLSLNLTSAPQPLRSKPENLIVRKMPKESAKLASTGGSTFKFTTGGKVGAIVARKAQSKKTKKISTTEVGKSNQKVHTEASSMLFIPKTRPATVALPNLGPTFTLPTVAPPATTPVTASERGSPTRNVKVTRVKKNVNHSSPTKKPAAHKLKTTEKVVKTKSQRNSNSIDYKRSHCKPATITADVNLILNVSTGPAKDPTLTKEQKRRLRIDRRSKGHVLTDKELDEGIRAFSGNPNRQPRASDHLEQRLRGGKDQDSTGQSGDQTVNGAALDTRARSVNAFRGKGSESSSTRKVDLFKDNPGTKILGQRLVKPIPERVFSGKQVGSLDLHEHTIKNLSDLLSITELTTVQEKAIPKALEDKNLLVRSQTGSGKTLVYALPIVEKLQQIRPKVTRDVGILGVIIVPTRELVAQTHELLQKLVHPFTWIVPGALTGGERRKAEKARLRKGINILVGTPGRLVDHLLHTEMFKLSNVRFLVLDEADRLMELGYERDVQKIVEAINKQRTELAEKTKQPAVYLQSMLLSATLTAAVQKLAGLALKDPLFIDNSDENPTAVCSSSSYDKQAIEAAVNETGDEDEAGILTIPDNLKLCYILVPPKLRLVTISAMLAKEFAEKQKLKAIIFMSTIEMVSYHHDLFTEILSKKVVDEDDEEAFHQNEADGIESAQTVLLKGLRFFKLYGSMTQTERQGVFRSFRECISGVLIATDVAGRGIDVPEVDMVIQYSPPQKLTDFVHRVGRTARAGRNGRAVLFLAPNEEQFVRHLEDKRIRITQVDMDLYLKALHANDNVAHTVQEAASNLQYKFQSLVDGDKEMHEKACKAFVSWTKFYSSFPKQLKRIFNVKTAHMGHFAKSFALNDAPKSFSRKHSTPKPLPPTNRLTYTERDPEKIKMEKRANKRRYTTTVTNETRNRTNVKEQRFMQMLKNSKIFTMSEFGCGLTPKKQKFS